MNPYQCPLCGRRIRRDLVLYLDHTQEHVMEQIKKEHPEWVAKDGVCRPCAQYYRMQMKGELGESNLGPEGRRRRFFLGVFMTGLTLGLVFYMESTDFSEAWRLLLFFPLFGTFMGFIQAREKTCAVLAEQGLWDREGGKGKIPDARVVCRLRRRGRLILIKSALSAAALAALFYLFL